MLEGFVNLLEFAQGFVSFGFSGGVAVNGGFEFFFFVVNGTERLAIVEGEAEFLEAGAT